MRKLLTTFCIFTLAFAFAAADQIKLKGELSDGTPIRMSFNTNNWMDAKVVIGDLRFPHVQRLDIGASGTQIRGNKLEFEVTRVGYTITNILTVIIQLEALACDAPNNTQVIINENNVTTLNECVTLTGF